MNWRSTSSSIRLSYPSGSESKCKSGAKGALFMATSVAVALVCQWILESMPDAYCSFQALFGVIKSFHLLRSVVSNLFPPGKMGEQLPTLVELYLRDSEL